jgi:hypothetical protein
MESEPNARGQPHPPLDMCGQAARTAIPINKYPKIGNAQASTVHTGQRRTPTEFVFSAGAFACSGLAAHFQHESNWSSIFSPHLGQVHMVHVFNNH